MDESNIRLASAADQAAIRDVHWQAFGPDERESIVGVAQQLLADGSEPPTLNLVIESARAILGHLAFSPVWSDPGGKPLGYILAPLAITPAGQGKGLGTRLVREGLARLQSMPVDTVLVYGDPRYYGRFGFDSQPAKAFEPPFPLQYPAGWQALRLTNDAIPNVPQKISCVSALNLPELW